MSDPADLLRAHSVPITAQRLAVLRAVSARPHGTADAIAEAVRADIGAISRQAVYDALGILAEKGLIRRIQPATRIGSGTTTTTRSVAPAGRRPMSTARSAKRYA